MPRKKKYKAFIANAYLLDITSDGECGKEIALVYSFMLVKIKGRNLHTLTIALQNNDCGIIQDYDPHHFAPPESEEEPFIEKIEIVTGG